MRTSGAHAATPDDYIASLAEPRRSHIQALHETIRKAVPEMEPRMQSGMIGYGPYHYVYASGREGDGVAVALSSRAQYISLYICAVDGTQYIPEKYRKDLPQADIGKSCVRFRQPEDLDPKVLKKMLKDASAWLKEQTKPAA